EVTRSLGEMIVRDLQPIPIVEDRGFNAFVKTLDPCYIIPSHKLLMEGTIADMYKDCQDKVRANCQRPHSVVLTTDMWTSRSTEAYLTVSLHKAGWKHYPCFVHTLNMVVKDGIKAVPEVVQLLEKCSSIVSFFHHSTKALSVSRTATLLGFSHSTVSRVYQGWSTQRTSSGRKQLTDERGQRRLTRTVQSNRRASVKQFKKRALLSLLGYFNFAIRNIPQGRTFISRLLALASTAKNLNSYINISSDARKDIKQVGHVM
ncbi:ZBED4 protein, partial [Polyodon spathula]|nr:ZBED4 protein [Polyodon spathula]